MKDHPIIGLSASRMLLEGSYMTGMPKIFVNSDYVDAISKAGGIPFLIPAMASHQELETLVSLCDGILMTGGMDVAPILYHEMPHPHCGKYDLEVDRSNLDLIHTAISAGKPILGICRGLQMINIALGGTLYQDIPSQCVGAGGHSFGHIRSDVVHPVTLAKDSRIRTIFQRDVIEVNSVHHQAIKDPGQGVRVTAIAPDGIIEAIEVPEKKIIAVQWHPEMLLQGSDDMLCLLRSFVEFSGNN